MTTELYGHGIWLSTEETATEVHSSVRYSVQSVGSSRQAWRKEMGEIKKNYIAIDFTILYVRRSIRWQSLQTLYTIETLECAAVDASSRQFP